MAIDIIARGMAANSQGGGGAVNSVNGKTGDVTLVPSDLGASASIIISAESNTTINGYQVPLLTTENIQTIYNGIVAGNEVLVSDATDNMHFKVNQADTDGDDLFISFVYFDIMILQYDENGNITYKEIASKAYVDNAIGNALQESY